VELQLILAKLFRHSCIRPSSSHYGSPIWFRAGPNSGLHLGISYRAAYHVSCKDQCSSPHIEKLVQLLGGSDCLSTIDFAVGYHQIRISAGDHQQPAVSTTCRLGKWMVLPFGLVNATGPFKWVMKYLLASNHGGNRSVAVDVDGVLLRRSTIQEHLDHVPIELGLVKKVGLKLKQSWCEWFCAEFQFCSIQMTQDAVHRLDSKFWAVTEWPWSQNMKQVNGFLSVMRDCCNIISHYVCIILRLYRMRTISRKVQCVATAVSNGLKIRVQCKCFENGRQRRSSKYYMMALATLPCWLSLKKGATMCCIRIPALMLSEKYYHWSDMMGRPESLHFGAGSLTERRRDSLHLTENSLQFMTQLRNDTTASFGTHTSWSIQTMPLESTYWHNLDSQHDKWSAERLFTFIDMVYRTSQGQKIRWLAYWQ